MSKEKPAQRSRGDQGAAASKELSLLLAEMEALARILPGVERAA